MSLTPAQLTHSQFGQSIWYDNIQKSSLQNGDFARLIAAGVRGCTSNPAIFNKAIAGSSDYDASLRRLVSEGRTVDEIYYHLVVDDIRAAAEALFPVYEASQCHDGYVSVEVQPRYARDTESTVAEALELHRSIARRNVMIKVPATAEGIPAITRLIAKGVSVNVTLIFARERYEQVAAAYIEGLEQALAAGVDLRRIASVASFFVSRIDSRVDQELSQRGVNDLSGKAAIANAKLAYQSFLRSFGDERFQRLEQAGAQKQRLLWASTGTKNPSYPDTLYVDELVGPDTVNTLPPATLDAFQDHGKPRASLAEAAEEATLVLASLGDHGISLSSICDELLDAGVRDFETAMDSLLQAINGRRQALLEQSRERQNFALGQSTAAVVTALGEARSKKLASRIWNHDPEAFTADPAARASIQQRLGWLRSPMEMEPHASELQAFAQEVYAAGFRKALLIGMGGSSLCPEVLAQSFGVTPGFLELRVIDSTVPESVQHATSWATLNDTLFIAASKSGSTIEVAALNAYFWQKVEERFGADAGSRFIAITDPGSPLSQLARERGYRRSFENDPNIGGRYSALSYFGLVPAALIGVDVVRLLEDGRRMAESSGGAVPADENPGVRLGAFMGGLARAGHDKLTLIASPEVASLGTWVEQLVAESTGKQGQGVVPVHEEPLADPGSYAADRAFVYLRYGSKENTELDAKVAELVAAGHPVATLGLMDLTDLGGEFYRWEMATAVAGALLGVNPFDEPNVSEAKAATGKLLEVYQSAGKLDRSPGVAPDHESILQAVRSAAEQDYVVFSAFIRQTQERDRQFARLRQAIVAQRARATTLGYGPRFLHSTGQLHKGGPNTCVVLLLTATATDTVPVPGAAYDSFNVLCDAQALGDLTVLRDEHRRRTVHVELGPDPDAGLERLVAAFERL